MDARVKSVLDHIKSGKYTMLSEEDNFSYEALLIDRSTLRTFKSDVFETFELYDCLNVKNFAEVSITFDILWSEYNDIGLVFDLFHLILLKIPSFNRTTFQTTVIEV